MANNLDGKVAIVTGSGQGIGRAIAMALATEGASVVTNNRKAGSTGFAIMNDLLVKGLDTKQRAQLKEESKAASGDAETTAAAIRSAGGEASAFFGDVSNFETARKLVQSTVEKYGRIDILVNVVGTFSVCPIWEMSEETWDKVCSIKPKAHFNCIRHVLPYMMQQKWGRIINCTSGAFKGGGIKQANYSAANAGVIGLTNAVAHEVYRHGITCNAFAPDARTRAAFEMTAYENAAGKGKSPWVYENFPMALGNSPSPDDLAPFICYLATEEAANITGSTFFVSGQGVSLYSESDFQSTITKYGGRWTVEELKSQVPQKLMRNHRSSVLLMHEKSARKS